MNRSATLKSGYAGFTLIELIVVITLVSIMLFISIPKIHRVFQDENRATAQWLLTQIPKLKARAISEKTLIRMHVDVSDNRLWVSTGAMSEAAMEQARNRAKQLPDTQRLADVEYPETGRIDTGEALIRFYPKGYSDKAIIHLQDDAILPIIRWPR